jgi:hypothetical protein
MLRYRAKVHYAVIASITILVINLAIRPHSVM